MIYIAEKEIDEELRKYYREGRLLFAISKLDKIEKEVLWRRECLKNKLWETALALGVSSSRIAYLHKKTLQKIKEVLNTK